MVKRRRGEDPAADAAASAAAEEARTACEEVIARITEHAAAKRLKAAAAAYAELAQRRLPDSLRARTALLHAHVNAGDRAGAWAQLEGIKAAGFTPNVVVFTALLKADSLAGDVRGARSTLDAMVGCRPRPVLPDTRAVNTFLRCCSRCGDTGAAVEIYARMADEWEVLPDATTYRLLSRLLAQALRLHEAQALATRHRESSVTQTAVEGAPAETGAGAGAVAHPPNQGTELVPGGASWEQKAAAKRAKKEWTKREKSAVPQCMFWQRGRCDRGNSCRFFHDPALAPQLVAELMLEKHGAAVEVELAVAAAAAGLSDWPAARSALERAGAARAALDEAAARDATLMAAFDRMRQAEIDKELTRLNEAAVAASPKSAKKLAKMLRNVFLFYPELMDMLMHTVGLGGLVAVGAADAAAFEARVGKVVSSKCRLRWRKVFGVKKGRELLPVKLEICSGSGDWAVAQALADAGKAHWAAMELRHDRVCHIFNRALSAGATDLCVVGGDASVIVPDHIERASVDHAYINFPEPPNHTGNREADTKHHLLTPAFFRNLHAALKPGGRLTIFSDQRAYCELLCETLSELAHERGGGYMFEAVQVKGAEAVVTTGVRVPLLCDVADVTAAGHAVAAESYFDKFWSNGDMTERFFVVVKARA
eukprot:PRCOL_00005293-RA